VDISLCQSYMTAVSRMTILFPYEYTDLSSVTWELGEDCTVKNTSTSTVIIKVFPNTMHVKKGYHLHYSTHLMSYSCTVFHFSISSRPAMGSTQPPIKWVPGAPSRGLSGRGVNLTTHLQLVPRSRKCGSIHPLPHTSSWRNA
jgi:hypothetical protein